MHRNVLRLSLGTAWGMLAAGVMLAGCGDDGPGGRQNVSPTAELTTSPVEGDTLDYRLRAFWTGSDPDGVIVHYEYAVDPPAVFTEAEIADPVGSSDVQTAVLPGSSNDIGRLRVSKTVDGVEYSFDWVRTLAFNHEFSFSATRADSVEGDYRRVPTGLFYGVHRIYVRAVDDDGAASAPDKVAFTAKTVAPVSVITSPGMSEYGSRMTGLDVTVSWDGTDSDGGGAKPVGYLYRIVDVSGKIWIVPPGPETLFWWQDPNRGWTYRPADSAYCALSLEHNGLYCFGVRAVDEAGAVEPFLDVGRNFFRIHSRASAPVPLVTVSEPSLGVFTFPASVPYPGLDVLLGMALHFSVACDASSYGGSCDAMRYSLNNVSLESDEGWSAWMPVGDLPPIVFERGGIHFLYIDVRDDLGGHTLAALILESVVPTFDRELLFVDDARDQTYPRDSEHDSFWESLFNDSGRFDEWSVDVYESFGANDVYSREPVPPNLATLLRYGQIVWECNGWGYNGRTGLWLDAGYRPLLAQYLRAGGKLWIGGALTVPALQPGSVAGPDFSYPRESSPGDFACDFLRLCSARIHNAKGGSSSGTTIDDNMIGAVAFPGKPEIYPTLVQDPNKISPFKGSISHCDAVFDPILLHGQPGFTGVLDSLYVYQAVDPRRVFQDKLCAVRWHDPDPARTQGRIQWFGFPLYYMQKEQAQETFNRSIDWFRAEQAP